MAKRQMANGKKVSGDGLLLGLLGDGIEHLEQDVVGLDAFGLRLEVEEDAVAEARQVDAAQVLETDIITSVEQSAHLGGEHEGLHTARTTPPADVLGRNGGGAKGARDRW